MFRILTWFCLTASLAFGAKTKLEEFHTTLLHHDTGIVSVDSTGVFIFFGGTGAKSENFGVVTTAGPFLNRLKKQNWDFVAAENPMYWRDTEALEIRREFIEKYGNLDAQTAWMVEILKYVIAQAGDKPVYVGTRSTGTAAILELVHRAYRGDERARIVSRVRGVIAMGLLDPHRVEEWYPQEVKFLQGIDRADMPVLEKDLVMFPAARFAGKEFCDGEPMMPVPEIFVTLGANDEVNSPLDQLHVVDRIAESHLGLRVTAIGLDTRHNPEGSVEYEALDGKMVKVKTMERMKPLLQAILDGPLPTEKPGLWLVAIPEFRNVKSVCETVHRRFADALSPF